MILKATDSLQIPFFPDEKWSEKQQKKMKVTYSFLEKEKINTNVQPLKQQTTTENPENYSRKHF